MYNLLKDKIKSMLLYMDRYHLLLQVFNVPGVLLSQVLLQDFIKGGNHDSPVILSCVKENFELQGEDIVEIDFVGKQLSKFIIFIIQVKEHGNQVLTIGAVNQSKLVTLKSHVSALF